MNNYDSAVDPSARSKVKTLNEPDYEEEILDPEETLEDVSNRCKRGCN